jgi:hypothetical protein
VRSLLQATAVDLPDADEQQQGAGLINAPSLLHALP